MKYLISAGPTREKIDPIRFLSNRSTGKMGYALAEAARDAGHEVVLVSGPVSLADPAGIEVVRVESAAEMAAAVESRAAAAEVVIMTAAVADYRPVRVLADKMKKGAGKLLLELERTEDILATLGRTKRPGQLLIGFAAETRDLLAYAEDKLRRKNLDWIVANDVAAPDRGIAADVNGVTMIPAVGAPLELPLQHKRQLATQIIAVIDRSRSRTTPAAGRSDNRPE
ncbi:MAG: phosphopantothenoylcysteine decarboxylase [Victivallales bacterium]|nr:phosphopantothenoylcysteine decarboxylase [Victivallales bacterium]